jgi:hypothetical protein
VNGFDSCTACHGEQLQGRQTAPSCFSNSFNGQSCHPDGPGQAPHPLDGSYLSGSAHGPDAKSDLTVCQACHGQPGGPGSNPRFNLGIESAGGNGCESCHTLNYAHPQDGWAGPEGTFHYSAGNIQNACTLCHGVNLDGAGGVGLTCLDCHSSATTFTLDCTYCHGSPPDGSADDAAPIGVNHGNVSNISSHDDCVVCHGMKESAPGGTFTPVANYALFDYTTDMNGDHWNGNINMNSDTQYNETNFGCDAAACHGNDAAHQLSDSGLAVELGAYGSGGSSVPHPLDGSYLQGANHGPDAKADLTFCQVCHGEAGGPGSNPRFNVGINSAGGTGCEACHTQNYAHPQDGWAGPDGTFHYSAGNIQNACTLCHGVNLDGVGGVGSTCLNCHSSATTFTLDCTNCHGSPPDGTADDAAPIGVNHGNVSNISSHDVCVVCHGMKESATGGSFSPVANYALFDDATDTNGDHWNGNINMNSDTVYNETNFGCDAAACHGNNVAHQLSDSGLTVVLGAYGSGGGSVPHPLDGSFLLPANHGPAAKGLTAAFPAGLLDCQPCHAQPDAGSNPRFNVGIDGNGCEGCHNDFTAHPSAGTRESSPWYNDSSYQHADVNGFSSMCTLCHGANLDGIGGVAGSCLDCHVVDPVANPSGCVSCHNLPPDGAALAGAVRPNREGRHLEGRHSPGDCAVCHNSFAYRTPVHFDFSGPADVVIEASFGDPEGTGAYNPAASSCTNITCHNPGEGSLRAPWY